jgi:hypothetical protein
MVQWRNARADLQRMMLDWDKQERKQREREPYGYRAALDELFFQADTRFCDFIQYQTEGEFPQRLYKWLHNVTDIRYQQGLFRLLRYLIFIDSSQLRAIYRDAYRRELIPWVLRGIQGAEIFLTSDFRAHRPSEQLSLR